MAKFRIESKVWAAIIGAGAGVIASDFVVWLIGVGTSEATMAAADAEVASASVAQPVVNLVSFLLVVGPTAVAGYQAKHTPRPEGEEVVRDARGRFARREPVERRSPPAGYWGWW